MNTQQAPQAAYAAASPRHARRSPSTTSADIQGDLGIEKVVKYLYIKLAQVVVESRQGLKILSNTVPAPHVQAWFCMAIQDVDEIADEAKKVMRGSLTLPLWVEISLRTADGERMVLENWIINCNRDKQGESHVYTTNLIYNHMSRVLKSVVGTCRALPAYRLSRKQGRDSFVICYKMGKGEPGARMLGEGALSASVGQSITPFGTFTVNVQYRTSMKFDQSPVASTELRYDQRQQQLLQQQQLQTASNTSNESGKTLPVNPLVVHTDHFDTNQQQQMRPRADTFGSRGLPSDCDSEQDLGGAGVTSDESQEAMRLFATSPPDPTTGGMFPEAMLNRRRKLSSNPSNSSLEKLKIGAFATPLLTPADSKSPLASEMASDPLLDLFSVDPEEEAEEERVLAAREAEDRKRAEDAMKTLSLGADEDSDSETPIVGSAPRAQQPFDFPQVKNAFAGNDVSDKDLEIFFKAAPSDALGASGGGEDVVDDDVLESEEQLTSIDDQIRMFENNLVEYDDMLRTLETSESESELAVQLKGERGSHLKKKV